MRFCLASLLVLLPILSEIHAISIPRLAVRQKKDDKKDQDSKDNKEKGKEDPQKSLTLDKRVIGKSFVLTGQEKPVEGQVESLVTTNNFINFCLTQPDLPLTDGQQLDTASCNTNPLGIQVAFKNMPSSKFVFPKNFDTVAPNKAFTVKMAIKNLATGQFTNAQNKYFAAPQQLNKQGIILGHSHVVIETLKSLTQTDPTDPTKFAFFKGLNDVAKNGVLTADVTKGLPAGAYRLCSINASANHLPCVVGKAQHGFLDDCVYFEATDDDKGKDDGDKGGKDGNDKGGKDDGDKKATTTKKGSKSTAKPKKQRRNMGSVEYYE